jgi:outer membrane biogenesis lipoprotein LolB
MRKISRRIRVTACMMTSLIAATLLLSACESLMARYNNSPAWQDSVHRSQEQDKKGNGCLKC